MWKPKLVALDLDGTLVAPDETIPAEAAAALADAAARGVHIVFATGRGWHATRPIADALALPPGPHVCSNGAVVVSYPPLKILAKTTFEARPIIERIAAEQPHVLLGTEVVGVGYKVNRPFPPGELGGVVTPVPLEELWSEPTTRVIVRDPGASDADFIRLAHHLGLEGVSFSIGYTAWLDIAPEGVNKAAALADVCERLGVDRADVLALGDGRNDIEMLAWAGRGVALGNAPRELKDVADAVTADFSDGGTAAELRRWF